MSLPYFIINPGVISDKESKKILKLHFISLYLL